MLPFLRKMCIFELGLSLYFTEKPVMESWEIFLLEIAFDADKSSKCSKCQNLADSAKLRYIQLHNLSFKSFIFYPLSYLGLHSGWIVGNNCLWVGWEEGRQSMHLKVASSSWSSSSSSSLTSSSSPSPWALSLSMRHMPAITNTTLSSIGIMICITKSHPSTHIEGFDRRVRNCDSLWRRLWVHLGTTLNLDLVEEL